MIEIVRRHQIGEICESTIEIGAFIRGGEVRLQISNRKLNRERSEQRSVPLLRFSNGWRTWGCGWRLKVERRSKNQTEIENENWTENLSSEIDNLNCKLSSRCDIVRKLRLLILIWSRAFLILFCALMYVCISVIWDTRSVHLCLSKSVSWNCFYNNACWMNLCIVCMYKCFSRNCLCNWFFIFLSRF